MDLPMRVGQESDGARLAAAEAGNCVRNSSGGNATGVRSAKRRWTAWISGGQLAKFLELFGLPPDYPPNVREL